MISTSYPGSFHFITTLVKWAWVGGYFDPSTDSHWTFALFKQGWNLGFLCAIAEFFDVFQCSFFPLNLLNTKLKLLKVFCFAVVTQKANYFRIVFRISLTKGDIYLNQATLLSYCLILVTFWVLVPCWFIAFTSRRTAKYNLWNNADCSWF